MLVFNLIHILISNIGGRKFLKKNHLKEKYLEVDLDLL